MCMNCVKTGKMTLEEANLMKKSLTEMTPTIAAVFGPRGLERHEQIMEELFGSSTQEDLDRTMGDISAQDLNTASSLLQKLVGDQIPNPPSVWESIIGSLTRSNPRNAVANFFGGIDERDLPKESEKADEADLAIPMNEMVVITGGHGDFNGTTGKVIWGFRNKRSHYYAVEIPGVELPVLIDRTNLKVKPPTGETTVIVRAGDLDELKQVLVALKQEFPSNHNANLALVRLGRIMNQ